MANFDEIARAARDKSQGILDAQAREKQVKQEAEDARLKQAFDVLHNNVVPVLEQARNAFLKDNIEVNITESESYRITAGGRGESTKIRIVTFECFSRSDQSQSSLKVIAGSKYVFEGDGSTIVAKPYGSQSGGHTFPGGTFDDFVAPIVAQALASYYEQLRRQR